MRCVTSGTFIFCLGVLHYYYTNSSTLQVAAMNALRSASLPSRPVVRPRAPETSRRAVYRERAPGVGYGNSSGYASKRSYASGWDVQPRFRCG
jgi:hypothetical protein